jgi:hypothetical protein
MIAGRYHIGAGVQRFAEYLLRDAEAASGVLAIDNDEIEPEIGPQRREFRPDSLAAGAADHIPQEKHSHKGF